MNDLSSLKVCIQELGSLVSFTEKYLNKDRKRKDKWEVEREEEVKRNTQTEDEERERERKREREEEEQRITQRITQRIERGKKDNSEYTEREWETERV